MVVTSARDIAIAAAVALAVTGGHAAYQIWPLARGTEITAPASLIRGGTPAGYAAVRLTFARIALDVPHAPPAPKEPFQALPRAGNWWTSGGVARVNAIALRGRPLYVQLTPTQPQTPDRPVDTQPSTVSDRPAAGAINVAGTVTTVRDDGYVELDFGFAPLPVPVSVPAGPAAAILRVLPSGRAVLVGVVVNGTRY
jgi:hypothetical protein